MSYSAGKNVWNWPNFDQIRLLGPVIPNSDRAWASYFEIGRGEVDRFPMTISAHIKMRARLCSIFLRKDSGGWTPLGATYYAHENGARRHWQNIENQITRHASLSS